jgi:alkanesulfonate monooxygenase SsuD/methylene tetrahydromethanopterin reductase-like flavin-dependent oxidoreductase (luciferase family)
MHLLVSLAAHGWHPAAWCVSGAEAFASAKPFRAMTRLAERGGLDAVLLGLPTAPVALRATGKIDAIRLDPLPLLGAMIGITQRIGLAAFWPGDVAEPYHVARVFATLDHLSGGRTGWIAGLAGGEELGGKYRSAALPANDDEAARRLTELIDVTRQLWDSWEDRGLVIDQASGTFADPMHVHPIEHSGGFFMVRGPLNVPRPIQGQPVIFCRDVPEGQARRDAAASAEVVLASCTNIADARASRCDWRTLLAEQGCEPDAVRFVARIMPILAGTETEARRRAAELDDLADMRGTGGIGLRFVGTPEQLAERLELWYGAAACDGFEICPAVLPTDLETLVEAVVPLLRARGLVRAGYEFRTLREHLGLRRAPSRFGALQGANP